jgi:hypothetical protein
LNETVDCFDITIGKLAVKPAQDSIPMAFDGSGNLLDLLDLTANCPVVPLFKFLLAECA